MKRLTTLVINAVRHGMQDGRRRRCIKYSRNSELCPVYHPYLPQSLQLFSLKLLSSLPRFVQFTNDINQRYEEILIHESIEKY